MPIVNPVTVTGLLLLVAVILPGLEVTVYKVMAEPPVFVGAVQETRIPPVIDKAVTDVGAPGTLPVLVGITLTI